MLQLDPATGALVVPIWMSAGAAAVLIVLAALAVARAGAARTVITVAVIGALGYAGWIAWIVTERTGVTSIGGGDRADERRAFDARVNDLTGRAMLPGSPLSCIDGTAGDQVAIGCEKLIFSGPDTIAVAVSYVAARLAMMGEATELAATSGLSYDNSLDTLRRGLESDRFGIVAYLLLQRATCKPEHCEDLALLRNPDKVRVNLLEKPFDVLVMRYSANWQFGGRSGAEVRGNAPVASAVPLPAPAVSGTGAPLASKYDFPSANSIPPVSIMNSEPAAPPAAAEKPAAAKAEKPVPTAAPKPEKPAPAAAPRRAAAPKPAPRAATSATPTPLAPAATQGEAE